MGQASGGGQEQSVVVAQEPAGVNAALRHMTSQEVNRTAFTFDHDMLQAAMGLFGEDPSKPVQLNSITVENYRYNEPAFYLPESMHALVEAFDAAGWKHLVDQNASPGESTMPTKPLTDLWLHYDGMEINGVTVVIRARRQMTVIEVSGVLRPLDLVHLSGHFGIPKVDPNAVMVPAAPGK
ncbi:MAG: hypothetical protein HIU91_14565 [Acidobacteria bacterium]|nr:hypothetical protein [Acidobacteriota bacterium]